MRIAKALFFLSGVAGLTYQVVWSRLLAEVFGVTAHAVTTVLATFLAGLALGGWLLGRVADRQADPLRFYGWLEIGIGIAGLVGTWTIRGLEPVHVWAANRLPPGSLALVLVRAGLASLVILPPTFLMGGTLPAITRVFVPRLERLGRELALLYALNTLGAVVGTLAAGFLLIRTIGLHPTLWVAVAINLAVGVGCLWLSGRRGAVTRETAATVATGAPSGRFGLLAVMAVSGFASLGLEVLWTRVLVLTLGTSTYAFVTMLAAFLTGITAGSLLARPFLDRGFDLRRALGYVQLGITLTTLATLPVLRWVGTGAAERWLEGLSGDWIGLIAGRFGVSFLVMLAPTTLIGATFPLAGRLWALETRSLGGRLGQVYGANTLGNILGAFVTGFVLLPMIGLQRGIAACALLSLTCALWCFLSSGTRPLRLAIPLALVVAGGIALLARWGPAPLGAGVLSVAQELLYYREDAVAVVSVYGDRFNPRQRSMLVDGITIGTSYRGVDEKQQALAHFPFLLRPDAPLRRVLSIGLGTGILLGEAAKHTSVESADCVEIAPGVIEGASLFAAFNDQVLANPRVRVLNDDGVNFLRRTDTRYDAILSDEKSRTGHAGNAVFFSSDYYGLCHDHLAPGGLMIQWVPLDVPPEELPVILRSFMRAFPHTYVWVAPPQSCFLVGTLEPLVLDVAYISRLLAEPASANLRRYGWDDAYGFIGMLVGDEKTLAPWLGADDTVNTLERPLLEFYSPRAYTLPPRLRVAANLTALAGRAEASSEVEAVGADLSFLRASREAGRLLLAASAALQRGEASGLGTLAEALRRAPSHGPLRYAAARAYFEAGSAEQARGHTAPSIELYRRAIALDPALVEARGNLASALIAQGEIDQAVAQYGHALELSPEEARLHLGLGVGLAMQRRFAEAAPHFAEALRINPAYAEARTYLAKATAALQ